jgi:hypothetical protein
VSVCGFVSLRATLKLAPTLSIHSSVVRASGIRDRPIGNRLEVRSLFSLSHELLGVYNTANEHFSRHKTTQSLQAPLAGAGSFGT